MGQCEATKAKYAAELENAGEEWRKPLDFWYAESLVYFDKLQRQVETLYEGERVRGSRIRFKKTHESTTTVYKSDPIQTEMAL